MRWIPLSLLITAMTGGGLSAQVLTVEEAVASALDANPAVHAAAARADAGASRAKQAKGHRWGRLDLAETFNYSNNPAEVFALTLNQERFDFDEFFSSDPNRPDALATWMTTLDLTLPVYTGGKIGARVEQAETMAGAGQETLLHTGEQAAFETSTAFVNLAKARENVELLNKAKSTTAEHVKLAEAYAGQGIILDADVLSARVYLSEMDEMLQQARNGAHLAEAALNFHMGADQATPRRLAPLPPPPSRSTGTCERSLQPCRP